MAVTLFACNHFWPLCVHIFNNNIDQLKVELSLGSKWDTVFSPACPEDPKGCFL